MFTGVNVSVRGQQTKTTGEIERNGFKELAPVIKGAGKFEICRQSDSLEIQAVTCQF